MVLFSSCFLCFGNFAFAAPEPVLLPDSPLYFLKTVYETFRYALALTPKEKVDLNLIFAETRLDEAVAMAIRGKSGAANKLITDYEKRINTVRSDVALLQKFNEDISQQKDALSNFGFSVKAANVLGEN